MKARETRLWIEHVGPDQRMVLTDADGEHTVVGTVTSEPCHLTVGAGAKVHKGHRYVGVTTVAFDRLNRFGRAEQSYAAGDTIYFEPFGARCGTASVHKSGGYDNGWRGVTRATTTEVTCTKCLKRGI